MKLFRFLILLTLFSAAGPVLAGPVRPGKIKRLFKRSEVLNRHHVGFALYDLGTKKQIFGHQEDKYFTPASNTKLFTFYAGLRMLKDSIPGLQYVERGDSLIFWGTGDPTLLHPDFATQPVLAKLAASGKKLFFVPGRYTGEFYGTGWAYDDYNEYYQPEMGELPVYGNVVRFTSENGPLTGNVKSSCYEVRSDSLAMRGRFMIRRDLFSNVFHRPLQAAPAGYRQEIPLRYSTDLSLALLSDTLRKEIGIVRRPFPVTGAGTWYSVPRDTLFRHMLQPSDNFMAEQILLMCAAENGLEMNAGPVIAYVKKNFLQSLPDEPQWVDGSGLSRQDLFTPRSMIRLCELIYQEFAGREAALFEL
ncbi:MAG TPA: D-alanyl-D-alanine carboxypeptidase, partial [Sphingobacteriaceae bacterium]